MNAVKRGRFISPTKNAELLLFNRIQTVKYLRVYGIYLVKGWPHLLKSSNYTYKTAATPFFIVLELSVTQLQNSSLFLFKSHALSFFLQVQHYFGPFAKILSWSKIIWTWTTNKNQKVNFDIDQNYLDLPKILLTLGSSCVPSVATLSVYFPTNNICHHQKTVKCQRNSL